MSPQQRRAWRALLASVGITLLLYWIPFGGWIAYPLVLLSTLAHELAHGLMAVAIGGDFESFVLNSDGSGAAIWSKKASRLDQALVAGAGLIGPSLAAAGLFLMAKRGRLARGALVFMGLALVVAIILVVRNVFGCIFVGLVAAAFLGIGLKSTRETAQFSVVFIGTQLALSVFSRSDYLFTDTARTTGGSMPSDAAQIATALVGPYWMWGGLAGLISLAVLAGGLWGFLKGIKD